MFVNYYKVCSEFDQKFITGIRQGFPIDGLWLFIFKIFKTGCGMSCIMLEV